MYSHGTQFNRPWIRQCQRCITPARRTFITDSLPSILVPPVVFTGLLVGLWTYKCIMTIIFQDKIIYMPYMPPFARSEKMEDYTASCKPVQWEHRHIKSMDGTKIAICIGSIPQSRTEMVNVGTRKHVVICYFQGNGSSPPPRLPLLSNVLKSVQAHRVRSATDTQYTIVVLAYRGYWTSAGRASQAGIELDAQALLQWVTTEYGGDDSDLQIVLWGQSIGAGIASTATATYVCNSNVVAKPPITGLVLETPFTGIKSMLLALYPQTWLPYRYLWPFLWNFWDSEAALRRIGESARLPKVLLLPATRDEVVPPSEVDKLQRICIENGLDTQRNNIMGALHTEATTRREGQEAVAKFVIEVSDEAHRS